jgi:Fe-S-cluster containining protein
MPLTEIRKKAKLVQRVYSQLEKENRIFVEKSGLHCPSGCGKCCFNKDITASSLEFIPLALHFLDQGILEERYWTLKNAEAEGCVLYNHDEGAAGRCSIYPYRGLICRVFGNSAMTDKNGEKKYLGCSILKDQVKNNNLFKEIVEKYAPRTTDYYMQLRSIDLQYGSLYLPINKAILKAMEVVYQHSSRRMKRSV